MNLGRYTSTRYQNERQVGDVRNVAVLWILLTAATTACPSTRLVRNELPLLLLGDSITWGYVSEPVGPSFAELLETRFGDSVKRIGCGGTTTLDWHPNSEGATPACSGTIRHYAHLAKPNLPARTVTVLLGTNDANGFMEPGGPVSVPDYADAIADLVDRLVLDGAESVILLTAPHNYANKNPEIDARLRGYRNEIRQLCNANENDRVHCGPDLYLIMGPELFAVGNPHPNATGHRLIANEIARMMGELCEL